MAQNIEIPSHLKNAPMVSCALCGHQDHQLLSHLQTAHSMTGADYMKAHPGQPILSELGKWAATQQAGTPALPQRREITATNESMIALFGRGGGENGTNDQPIKVFNGYTFDDGVPEIDPHYIFPESIRFVSMAIETGRGLVYAFGPTGSGKTSMVEQYAARTRRPFFRIQVHTQMDVAEVYGMMIFNTQGQMVFEKAPLPVAMLMPSIVCFDEFDSGNPVILAILNGVLEGKGLTIPQTRERVHLHPDCKLVGTGNTSGMGDETGLYTSTSVQSFATMDRWEQFIELDYLKPDIEAPMLKRRNPKVPPALIDNAIKFANVVRDGFKTGKCSITISTRTLMSWMRFYRMSGLIDHTYAIAFGNRIKSNQTDLEFCNQAFQRVFNEDPRPALGMTAVAASTVAGARRAA